MKEPVFLGTATALVTPFDRDGVDFKSLDQLLKKQLDAKIPALVLCGTTGEGSTLSKEEKAQIWMHCVHYTDGACKIIAGIGSNSTQSATELAQTAEGVSIQVQRILDEGTDKIKTGMGYTFNDEGLRISSEGSQIENKLDHTGMYVSKLGENVLQATADGVKTVDITVKNYLVVGSHARFENYTDGSSRNRTACFYLEGGT